jgi:hypothetical protein
VRARLGLDAVIGCSPQEYQPWAPVDSPSSLWHLFLSELVPTQLPRPGQKRLVFVGSTGSFRWNLYPGRVTLDDTFIVNPFQDPFWATSKVPGPVLAVALSAILHKKGVSFPPPEPARGARFRVPGLPCRGLANMPHAHACRLREQDLRAGARRRTWDAAWDAAAVPEYVSSVAPEDLDAALDYDLAWFQVPLPVSYRTTLPPHPHPPAIPPPVRRARVRGAKGYV